MDAAILTGDKPIKGIDDKSEISVPATLLSIAPEQKMTPEQIMAIRAPTPKHFIKGMEGRGKKKLSYVPVSLYIRKLNFVFGYGAWSFEIVKSDIIEENHAVVQGKLVIPGLNMSIGQFGGHPVARKYEDKMAVDIGDTLKAAASDCLKKCCSMLGMFADVYAPNDFVNLEEAVSKATAKKDAKTKKDGPTQEQKDEIDSLAQQAGVTKAYVAKRVREIYHVSITEITPIQAAGVIEMLKKKIAAPKA